MKLSENQKFILRHALDSNGRVYGGRNGWNANWLWALQRRGLLTLKSKHTWDSEWRLTEAGFEAAHKADDEWRKKLGLDSQSTHPTDCDRCGHYSESHRDFHGIRIPCTHLDCECPSYRAKA